MSQLLCTAAILLTCVAADRDALQGEASEVLKEVFQRQQPGLDQCEPNHGLPTISVGNEVSDRRYTDNAVRWTFVDDNMVTQQGRIMRVTLVSGRAYKPIQIGIYRRAATGGVCDYRLIKTHMVTVTTVGLHKIRMPDNLKMDVLPGDHIGFAWYDYGVIKYDASSRERYCETSSVTSTPNALVRGSRTYSRRTYSFSVEIAPCHPDSIEGSCSKSTKKPALTVGHEPHSRHYTDSARLWTFVDDRIVTTHGMLTMVKLYSKVSNRPLDVGVYRPSPTGTLCDYTLIKRFTISHVAKGYSEVPVEDLEVLPGDHIGFTFTNYGVVAYDGSSNTLYCEKSFRPSIGERSTLTRTYGRRTYSFTSVITPCD